MMIGKFILMIPLLFPFLASAVALYSYRMDPREHPDDERRAVKPPSFEELGGKMHFIAYRGLREEGYRQYIDRDDLGDFIWPAIDSITASDITQRVAAVKRRGLYLFDVWGWVPGGGAANAWAEYSVPQSTFELFEKELGDKWLGMDNGEQDGRYVGRFAAERVPFGEDRFAQYLNFQRHFERMDFLLGNKMATLVSLNFGHYFLRENCYTLIGAETAQALPNAQVYYSWIRGAGKQYGVPWFGNVSIFTRWGWKAYPQKVDEKNSEPSPTKGTSLALMKKLFYSQIFYNSSAVGFEGSLYWDGKYTSDGKMALSPIGEIHREAQRWYAKNGEPGIMCCPVALMVDFYSGWSFPRHLYTSKSYLVWGQLPYEEGDHLTDGILDMIYPGYQDSSYFRDERGFNVDTPYGDIADCILSDAPVWLLKQYSAVILSGKIRASDELRDNLIEYVRAGGELCLTKGNAKWLFPSGFDALDLGKGKITPIRGGDWGVETKVMCSLPITNNVEVALAKPHPLTDGARSDIDQILRRQMIFSVSENAHANGLSLVTCRLGRGKYTVLIANNTWQERSFKINSYVGSIRKIEELDIASPERSRVGFAPEGISLANIGKDSASTIAAGGVRAFRLEVEERNVKALEKILPPRNASKMVLALRSKASIKEQILQRPTFFRHFGGVMVDWTYLRERDNDILREEANWLGLQQVKIVVDMSSAYNMFPDLRLVDNNPVETERSEREFKNILRKMKIIGAKNLIVSIHSTPETNMKREDAIKSMQERLKAMALAAARDSIVLHIRQGQQNECRVPQCIVPYLAGGIIKFAPSLATMPLYGSGEARLVKYMLRPGEPYWEVTGKAPIYFLSAPARDINGVVWSLHRPMATQTAVNVDDYKAYLKLVKEKDAIFIFDALYTNQDEEYRDIKFWNEL